LRDAAGPFGSRLPQAERISTLTGSPGADTEPGALLSLLSTGRLEVTGRVIDASNATFYGHVDLDGVRVNCVYKPTRGERPLWDFPDGTLADREVATYLICEAMGWTLVPPTVLRAGPFGPGMCQLWISSTELDSLLGIFGDGQEPPGWLPVLHGENSEGEPVTVAHADDSGLRRLCLLDVVVNNADRKGGHLLLTAGGELHGVDHGICLHREDKLRTVLWGWAGEPLRPEERDLLGRLSAELDAGLGETLGDHLTQAEVEATRHRVRELLRAGCLPEPASGRPAVPWPPF
jgi:uncharacterized repeat protein (TIGR03843 family)